MSLLVSQIKSAARELGFEVVGIAAVAPLAADDQQFRDWCDAGFAADMDYLTRRIELNAHPKRLVPYAASLITVAVNYYAEAPPFHHENRYGRVARYAWGLDYHDVVRARLLALVARIETLAERKLQARCFVDAVPLLERAVAASAGMGFFGKNTNLLQAQKGSWYFLAEVLLDLELPTDGRQLKVSCGTCHRCLDACPTEAFAGAYRLDSRRCISYLTIENKGMIARELRAGLGEWLFGCDVCQEVCPFNRFAEATKWQEFEPQAGAGARLDLVELLAIETDEAFRRRFQGTPLLRPKRRGLLRNAAVVAANVGCTAAVPILQRRATEDPEPLIRAHALWALSQLDAARAAAVLERALRDESSLVRQEAQTLCEPQASNSDIPASASRKS